MDETKNLTPNELLNNPPAKKTPEEKLSDQSDKLDSSTTKLATKLVRSKNINVVKDLTDAFNIAQAKKNVLRTLKLSDLLDNMLDRVSERITSDMMGIDPISNKDLASYINVIQSALDKSSKNFQSVSNIDAIQLNQQNNVNINVAPGVSAEERENITEAVNAILKRIREENNKEPITEDSLVYEVLEDDNEDDSLKDTNNFKNLLNGEDE